MNREIRFRHFAREKFLAFIIHDIKTMIMRILETNPWPYNNLNPVIYYVTILFLIGELAVLDIGKSNSFLQTFKNKTNKSPLSE